VDRCIDMYVAFVRTMLVVDPQFLDRLRGKTLACWCPLTDKHGNKVACHADVLLSIANDISIEEIQHENIRRAKRETT